MKRALLIVVACAGPAAAQPLDGEPPGVCGDPIDEPIAVAWREARADENRGACLFGDVAFTLGGRVLIDEPDFYGTLGGEALFMASFTEGKRWEWGLGLRIADVAYVQNAVWKLTDVRYGPLVAHVATSRPGSLGGRALQRAIALRVDLPYTESRLEGSSGAAQLAALATWHLRPRLRLHGRAMALGWYGRSNGGTSVRGAGALSIDVSWRALGWLTPTAGVDLQAGWYDGVDHLAVRAGAHWRVKGPWRVEAAAGVPLVGSERQDLAVTLGVRRDLD